MKSLALDRMRLTIVLPVFNGEKYIERCLSSLANQRTRHKFEVVVVDDGSTDGTSEIVEAFLESNRHFRLISLRTNQGKGKAVRTAYNRSDAEFVLVLDADDFLSSVQKVERQINEMDRQSKHFCGVAHNTLIVENRSQVRLASRAMHQKGYSYQESISFSSFYHHTSAQMFLRIPEGLPPEFDSLRGLRGDSAFNWFHCFYWKRGVFFYPVVHSVYDANGEGIWTSLGLVEKHRINLDVYRHLQHFVEQDTHPLEWKVLRQRQLSAERALGRSAKAGAWLSKSRSAVETIGFESAFLLARRIAALGLKEPQRTIIFRSLHRLELLDSFVESMGRYLFGDPTKVLRRELQDLDTIVILVSGIDKQSGGVFQEIIQLIGQLSMDGMSVYLVVTGQIRHFPEDQAELSLACASSLSGVINLESEAQTEKLDVLASVLKQFGPVAVISMLSHVDFSLAAIQGVESVHKIIIHMAYDHGHVPNLCSSSVDYFVTKSSKQVRSLAKTFPLSRVVRVPIVKVASQPSYEESGSLEKVTCTASAREYKYEINGKNLLPSFVAACLIGGAKRHVHFGPISEQVQRAVSAQLNSEGIDLSRFVNIEFAKDLKSAIRDEGVRVMVAPIVPSILITLDAISQGVILIFDEACEESIIEPQDYAGPYFLRSSSEGLASLISSLTPELLNQYRTDLMAHYEALPDSANYMERLKRLNSDPQESTDAEKVPDAICHGLITPGIFLMSGIFEPNPRGLDMTDLGDVISKGLKNREYKLGTSILRAMKAFRRNPKRLYWMLKQRIRVSIWVLKRSLRRARFRAVGVLIYVAKNPKQAIYAILSRLRRNAE